MKKIISILLSTIMLIVAFSTSVIALAEDSFNVLYDQSTQTIVVKGEGDFNDKRIYEQFEIYNDGEVKVFFDEGITSIGEDVLAGCKELSTVSIPKSVKLIKKGGFSDCDELKTVYFAGTKSEWKQIRVEKEGNEDFLDASVKYGEFDAVNYAPLYACLGTVVVLGIVLTVVATRKRKKQ